MECITHHLFQNHLQQNCILLSDLIRFKNTPVFYKISFFSKI